MLAEYLQANETELSSDQIFVPYYDTIAARSPTKTTIPQEVPQTRSRRRTSRYTAGTASFDNASTYIFPLRYVFSTLSCQA
jgi:hypothetical protein